ncbi:anti-sigma factor domain-containing protein [Pseudalkalibacillus hwajinpoensis]|uniref:anti-sigma factor domain-containing protein n=1 Tax=Guptibacillus hwajinpoensis TaxID=208199 RepID=UPI00325BB642
MKQGVIMDIRGRKAVVLTPDGEFTTIDLKRNHTLTIGSEIKLTPKPVKKRKGYFPPTMPTLAGMAAILLFVVIVTGVIPVTQNDAVAAYVSFDINPSIEVGVNSDLEIVQYQALNSDGEGLHLDRDTTNMPLGEFAGLLVSKLESGGYLADGSQLLIVATDVEQEERYKKIKSALEAVIHDIEQNKVLTNKSVAITSILDEDYSMRQAAIENGLSPGKYLSYLAALDRGATLTLAEVQNLSVKKMDELQSESLVAVESNPSENTQKSTELEDSVVQLNDEAEPAEKDFEEELILDDSNRQLNEVTKESVPSKEQEQESSNQQQEPNKETTKPVKKDDDGTDKAVVKEDRDTDTEVIKAQQEMKENEKKTESKVKKDAEKEAQKEEKEAEREEKKAEKEEKQLKKAQLKEKRELEKDMKKNEKRVKQGNSDQSEEENKEKK